VVRAANGASTQYTVALTRLAPVTQAYLSALVSVDDATGAAVSLIPAKFEPVTYVYRIETHIASVSLTFIAFSEGEISVDGGAAALGLKTMTIATPAVGAEEIINVVVTAQDAVTFRTYTVTVGADQ